MFHQFPAILAANDDSSFKLVFGVIVIVIWAISSLFKAIKQKAQQAQQRARMNQLPVDIAARPPQAPLSPPLPATLAPTSAGGRPPRSGKRGKATPPPPPHIIPPSLPIRTTRPEPALRPIAATTQATVRLALQPQALRRQFVVNEILGKPLALRDGGIAAHPPT